MIRVARATIACCALAAGLALATGGVAAAKPAPTLGIWDSHLLSGTAAERGQWFDRTANEGATQVTIQANWRSIAPSKPANPANPADPAYDWSQVDAAVRDANARGLNVMLMLFQAPDWAEGPNRASTAAPGTWRPDPNALAQFATAAATRYSGSYHDPLSLSGALPKVSLWEIWGEPNFYTNLEPQWAMSGGKWRVASPLTYRAMVNASYDALKQVDPANQVVAGGLAPVGDYKVPGQKLAPLRFWREFFCLRGRHALKPKSCHGAPPHLDVIAGNPLSVFGQAGAATGAFDHAVRKDDTYPPEMHKISQIVRAASKHGRVEPRGRKPLWATELVAYTHPPSPAEFGISQRHQANYLADALYVLWKQKVSNVTWVGITDSTHQGNGLYLADGTPKLSAQAYRFPFVVRKKGSHHVRVWGMAPSDGAVDIERKRGSGFKRVATLHAKSRIFTGVIRASKRAKLRATEADASSLTR